MVTTAGAETLPFLASCVVLPASLGFFMAYGKMVEALPSVRRLGEKSAKQNAQSLAGHLWFSMACAKSFEALVEPLHRRAALQSALWRGAARPA